MMHVVLRYVTQDADAALALDATDVGALVRKAQVLAKLGKRQVWCTCQCTKHPAH